MIEEKYQIWGKEILTAIYFYDEEKEPEERSVIQEKIKFINTHQQEILNSASYLHELAEDWLLQEVDDDTVDLDELTSVIREDGIEIKLPITKEDFRNSLHLIDLMFDFEMTKNSKTCEAFLEFYCEPDYFWGHRVHIRINQENKIKCTGI